MTIPRFQKITDWLYRGGQPDAEGFEELLHLGVKSIVSLRWSSEIMARERAHAVSLGFNYFTIPLSYCVFPTRKQIAKFFAILDESRYHSIFVHCKHGSDRTGMMIAFYRMSREGWSVEDAYAEMVRLGFHKTLVYHYKYAVFGYSRRLTRNREEASSE